MDRVIVIGCPGSGKSTFARKLRDKTGLPLFYLDQIWHRPDRTNIPREEFDARLREILKEKRWIIDGNYSRTLEARLNICDTVFLLDFPLDVCISGVKARIGKKREDLPWVEDEFDDDFRRWILGFAQDTLPQMLDMLERRRHEKTVIAFKSRAEADRYIDSLPGRSRARASADDV